MTPVTPPRKKVKGDGQQVEPDEEVESVEGEEVEREESGDEEDDKAYGASSAKKRKSSAPCTAKGKAQGASKPSNPTTGAWTEAIRQDANLQRQSGHVVLKMRREFKKTEIALGGDGKWLDDFKLHSGKKAS